MTIRESLEQWEQDYLSPYASLSVNSKGRLKPEEQCDIRPVFQRDRDRIIHCKAFRRLKDKTQVFLTPEGDHYRTRLTHTLEVSQTARTIAKALKLNEDLVEAIALGHDLGHTPFGHAGERALNRVCPFGFEHAEQSVRTVDILEKDGKHTVRKYPAASAAAAHIEALAENECVFTERFKGSTLSVNRLELKRNPDGLPFAEIEYLENSRTLEELLDECLQNNDEAGFDKLFDRYCKIAAWKAEGTKQDYDLTFPNICVQGDIWTMIDYEWTTDKLTPQQIISRALNCYGQEDPVRMEHPIVKKHLEALGIGKEQMRELSEKELAFQHFVLQEKDGRSRTALGQLRHLIGNRAVPYQEFFARADRKKVQVFEDFGAGYTPEHSYYQYDAYEADDLINARIICKAGTKAIRLDPAELPCLVQIHGIEWRGKALTRAQLDQCLSTNGQVLADTPSHVPTVLFETGDPNISVRLDCLDNEATDGEALIIRAQIAWLSAEMLQDIQARLAAAARRKGFWFQR